MKKTYTLVDAMTRQIHACGLSAVEAMHKIIVHQEYVYEIKKEIKRKKWGEKEEFHCFRLFIGNPKIKITMPSAYISMEPDKEKAIQEIAEEFVEDSKHKKFKLCAFAEE